MIEIPRGTSPKPIEIKFTHTDIAVDAQGNDVHKDLSPVSVASSFSGELCYRLEGTTFNPVVSNCDNSVGDAASSDIRQIRFQNDAGYDNVLRQ